MRASFSMCQSLILNAARIPPTLFSPSALGSCRGQFKHEYNPKGPLGEGPPGGGPSGPHSKGNSKGNPKVANNALATITLMVALSKPEEKELMVLVIVNSINKDN